MIKNILFSTRTMGVLLILYALAMADATFVENDYGTPVAKELIYNAWWFEAVMTLLTAGWARLSWRAARVMLPATATVTNERRCRISTRRSLPSMPAIGTRYRSVFRNDRH